MSQALRDAIKSKLAADSVLPGLAPGGIFSDQPPANAETPYLVFSKMDGRYQHAFRDPSLHGELYLVKGISRKKAEAEAIDTRCRAILSRISDLNINGHETKSVLIDHDVDYAEQSDGDRFDHVGTVYRIVTE